MGAALRSLPHIFHSLLRRAWPSWAFCDAQAPVMLEFFVPLLDAIPHQWVFPNLVRKLCCTVTVHCIRTFSSMQTAFSAPVTAIFTQPALLAATDETKRPCHVQINLESFSVYMWLMLKSFPPVKCPDFVKCVGELWITLCYSPYVKLLVWSLYVNHFATTFNQSTTAG
jgi:hypothetical protein